MSLILQYQHIWKEYRIHVIYITKYRLQLSSKGLTTSGHEKAQGGGGVKKHNGGGGWGVVIMRLVIKLVSNIQGV